MYNLLTQTKLSRVKLQSKKQRKETNIFFLLIFFLRFYTFDSLFIILIFFCSFSYLRDFLIFFWHAAKRRIKTQFTDQFKLKRKVFMGEIQCWWFAWNNRLDSNFQSSVLLYAINYRWALFLMEFAVRCRLDFGVNND